MLRALEDLGAVVGLRRKRSFVDKVQDAIDEFAHRARGTAWETYATALKSAKPTLDRSSDVARKARETYGVTLERLGPVLAKSGGAASKATGKARKRYETTVDSVGPVLVPALAASGKAATRTLTKAAETAATSLESVQEAASAATAAATGAAGATGRFFRGLFAWSWWLAVFAFKTAVLAGVTYLGWQWLQSRRSKMVEAPPSYSATYGPVTPAPATSPVSVTT